MAYNAHAESFSIQNWQKFIRVYWDITDATPINFHWKVSQLIDQLPSISHLSAKTQADIIRVVIRDMQKLPEEADRVKKVPGAAYMWEFSKL